MSTRCLTLKHPCHNNVLNRLQCSAAWVPISKALPSCSFRRTRRHYGSAASGAQPPIKGRRIISTLNPYLLRPSDFVDISGRTAVRFQFSSAPPHEVVKPPERELVRMVTDRRKTGPGPFPPGTNGFLYFHSPPDLPITASEIRFRMTRGDGNPSNLYLGRDLLVSHGMPWRIPVFVIASYRTGYHDVLRRQLHKDNLITETQFKEFEPLFHKQNLRTDSDVIHDLGQPFPMAFDICRTLLHVVVRTSDKGVVLRHMHVLNLYSDYRVMRKNVPRPFSGSAIVRFERSTLPSHRNIRAVVLRIVKIVRPLEILTPSYDGYIPKPIEGGLWLRSESEVWSRDVDEDGPLNEGLKLLWDQLC